MLYSFFLQQPLAFSGFLYDIIMKKMTVILSPTSICNSKKWCWRCYNKIAKHSNHFSKCTCVCSCRFWNIDALLHFCPLTVGMDFSISESWMLENFDWNIWWLRVWQLWISKLNIERMSCHSRSWHWPNVFPLTPLCHAWAPLASDAQISWMID